MPTPTSEPNQAQYGVFFDGTGNNYFVDKKYDDDTYEPTNIAKLYELYFQGQEQRIGKQYVNGIGTRDVDLDKSGDEAEYSGIEMAFGIGIQDRIDEAIKGIVEFIEPLSDINVIHIDVFGFSRGAATARIFVNAIQEISQKQPDKWLGTSVKVRFLGIFDTVGSIGVTHDGKNFGYNLNIHPDSVSYACHLTAHNEYREYFPLTSLKDQNGSLAGNFFEKALLGAHSDVGGGYGPESNKIFLDSDYIRYGGKEDKREKQRLTRITNKAEDWKAKWKDYLSGKWKESDGEIEVKERRIQKNGPDGQPNSHKQLIRYIWNRTLDKRLAHVALHLMIEHARNNSVPLIGIDALRDLAEPLDYEVPAELADYMIAVDLDKDIFTKPFLSLYPNFIHHSHQFKIPEGGAGLVNPNAVEGLERKIFDNKPEDGLHG